MLKTSFSAGLPLASDDTRPPRKVELSIVRMREVLLRKALTYGELDKGCHWPHFILDRQKPVAADCGLPFGVRTMKDNSRWAQDAGEGAKSRNGGGAFHMAVFEA